MRPLLLSIALFGFGATVTILANWLALRPWLRSAGEHWTERARLLWPARFGAVWNVLVAAALGTVLSELVLRESAPPWYFRLLAGIGGGLAGSRFFDREVFPGYGFAEWVRHQLANWGMHLLLAAVLISAILLMPDQLNLTAAGIGAASLAALLAIRLKLGLWVLGALRIVEPADASLVEQVRAVGAQLGINPGRVRVIGGPLAAAYALPVHRELWFSRRLLAICTEEELRAIAAHELAHLGESRPTVAGRVAASVVWWPFVFTQIAVAHFGLRGLAGLFVLCLGLGWLSRRLSFRLERRADALAAGAEAAPGVYAGALEKLYRENRLPAVNPGGQRTHPSLYDRLLAAGKTPDYARPRPPDRLAWPTKLLIVLWLAATVALAILRDSAEVSDLVSGTPGGAVAVAASAGPARPDQNCLRASGQLA